MRAGSAVERSQSLEILRWMRELDRERTEAHAAVRLASRLNEACTAISLLRERHDITAHLLTAAHGILRFGRVAYFTHAAAAVPCFGLLRLEASLAEEGLGAALELACPGERAAVATGSAHDLSAPSIDVRGWYVLVPLGGRDNAPGGRDHALGVLYADAHPVAEPRDDIVARVAMLAAVAAAALANAHTLAVTRSLAACDPLTGLLNRRALYDRLERELAANRECNARCACAILNVDDLKQINDYGGHLLGDSVLRLFARTLAANARERDVAARIGGDEFVLVLHDVEVDSARRLVRQLCAALHAEGLRCSVGVALSDPARDGVDSLLRAADRALYAVKAAGKNGFAFG